MSSYYNVHEGNLHPGDIAKAEDINLIQRAVIDMIANYIDDDNNRQGCILGSDENAFLLTPETKHAGRYIDQMNLTTSENEKYISIRQTTYRQAIKLSRSSLYSVIVKMQNLSEKDVQVQFELQDANENLIENKRTTLNLPAKTNPTEFEIVFDLDYYPTAHGFQPEDLMIDDSGLIIPDTNQQSFEESADHTDEEKLENTSAGASEIFLVIYSLNRDKFDVFQTDDNEYIWNDEDPTFGILMNKNSNYGQLLQANNGSGYVQPEIVGDLYFKEVYANSPTYACQIGEALVGGEKVLLADTHVTVAGGSAWGDVLSYVYMDIHGHLKSENSAPFTGDEPAEPIPVTEPHLHIATIRTYVDDIKPPLITQDDTNQQTRLRSHHERIRRLENLVDWTQDISIPPRFKFTLTGEDWIDEEPAVNLYTDKYDYVKAQKLDALTKDGGYMVTTDANGNFIIKVSKAESFSIPITLKSEKSGVVTKSKDSKTKIIKSAQTSAYINSLGANNKQRAQTFAEMSNMNIDVTNGVLTLESETDEGFVVASTAKEAKETEFNPWDDVAANRISTTTSTKDDNKNTKSSKNTSKAKTTQNIKPTTRAYTVNSGKNGANDWDSEFPAMTLYVDTSYKLSKLSIPIYKFKNCTGVKFIIWKRQGPNNKTNTVWFEKRIYTSKVFSLKNAKLKNGYQYMDDGFLIDFGKSGLTLPKGQYVIVAFPSVSSGQGTIYVDTYKPANPRDFCIRYYGAANGSHFLLKTRYPEIWYNPSKATGTELTYKTSGQITSGTVTWENVEPIKSIKPMANLTQPSGTKATFYVDTGGGWKEVTLNKSNAISGNGESFRWKVKFTGNKKSTPTIKYDKKKKYAITFEITRAEPNTDNQTAANQLDANLCITSKPFDGNKILRDYIGDMNFALTDNKFSNYEFARVWATDSPNNELSIDISASDREEKVLIPNSSPATYYYYPVYSLHYVDLSLDDFSNTSVDYANYDPQLEIDEHNLRLKLDTEHSYNDNDISLIDINQFKLTDASIGTEGSDLTIDLSKITAASTNQTLAKVSLPNPLNLAKYGGIKIGLKLNGTANGTLSGLAFYISATNETETPSNLNHEPTDTVQEDTLPDLNSSQESVINQYANKIIKRFEPKNGTGDYVYYKSIWNSANEKWEWQLLHDVKSYHIYEIIDRTSKSNTLTITSANNNKTQYYEIEVDPDDPSLQNATEIGLILLNDENKYSSTDVTSITLTDFKSIENDYYKVFEAKEKNVFKLTTSVGGHACYASGSEKVKISGTVKTNYTTTPPTSQISIIHQNVETAGQDLAKYDATTKFTTGFKHVGIQLACDCPIVKNMLELHFRKKDAKTGITTTIDKIKLPTLNYAYYPTTGEDSINLTQIFKKIKIDDRFDEIVLYATPKFKQYAKQLKTSSSGTELEGADGAKSINLFIGNIVLYKAETIPIFHPVMRMKFYLDDVEEIERDTISIRKIGAVLDYQ